MARPTAVHRPIRQRLLTATAALLAAAALMAAPGPVQAQQDSAQETVGPRNDRPFDAWLQDLRAEARNAGIGEGTLESALSGVAPVNRVIELDRRQPEFTQTFWTYMDKRVSERRIERGRELLAKHRPMLERIAADGHRPLGHAEAGVPHAGSTAPGRARAA